MTIRWGAALALLSLITGARAAPSFAVGQSVLLAGETQVAGPDGQAFIFLAPPFLTNKAGRAVARAPWLARPLKIIAQSASAYTLADGAALVWLPKRNLAAKAALPLAQDEETRALAVAFAGRTVWGNGGLRASCELLTGYTASLALRRARVTGIWRLRGYTYAVSPQGGLVQGALNQNARSTSAPLLVTVDQAQEIRVRSSAGEAAAGPLTPDEAVALARQRCGTLGVIYADADDLRRNLRLTEPPRLPPLPDLGPDDRQEWLIGKSRADLLTRYGNPNEEGTLEEIFALPIWRYGGSYFDFVRLTFGPHERVIKAEVSRSP